MDVGLARWVVGLGSLRVVNWAKSFRTPKRLFGQESANWLPLFFEVFFGPFDPMACSAFIGVVWAKSYLDL